MSEASSMAGSILVAIATYNERDSLPSLVDALLQVLPQAHIVVVDDNSPDGTGHWCDEHRKDESRLSCLHRPGKLGLGSASIVAMKRAIELDYELLITLDADWSHDPANLPAMVARAAGSDIVIGSRYCPGGTIEGWPWHRRVISSLLNGVSCRLLRLPVKDASGAFRVYRVDMLRRLALEDIRATGYSYLEEILCYLHRAGASFEEVPITFRERRAGHSKATLAEAIGKIATIGRLIGK